MSAFPDNLKEHYGTFCSEATAFLADNRDLETVLLGAVPIIRSFFEHCDLSIQYVYEPYQGRGQILVVILTNLSAELAMAQLDKFDDYWFLDRCEQVGGRLNFDVRFGDI